MITKVEGIDTNKLIDDAIAKKDRSVCIHVNGGNMSIYIEPLEKHDPRWILHEETTPRNYRFECSECHGYSREGTSYCPHCGDKLRMPTESDFKKEAMDDAR